MATEDTKEKIISKAFDHWADKVWFQVIAVIFVIYLMSAPVVGPVIYNYINKSNTAEAVTNTLDERDMLLKEKHRIDFEKSKSLYATSKNILKAELDRTRTDYILFIEYHNGIENISTGIQFCRFDITLEVLRDSVEYINLEKYRDDIVARYDILLSEEFETFDQAKYYTIDDLYHIDRYFEMQMRAFGAKSCAIVNVENKERVVCGTLLFISMDLDIDMEGVYKCRREIEQIFRS